MSLLDRLHGGYVHKRRVAILSTELSRILPKDALVLDVGCGDGELAAKLSALRPDVRVEGIDVLAREHCAIPLRVFDGAHIPYDDACVDVVLLIDVLHHAEDPAALLRESARVSRSSIVIKDHLREGVAAGLTLRMMDWVGNARHGVRLPYNYWTRAQWNAALRDLGLDVRLWRSSLHLYPKPATWLFDRSLHFVAMLGAPRC